MSEYYNRYFSCGMFAYTQRHHKFAQHKRHRSNYGSIIDEPFNIEYACPDCHTGHRNIPGWAVWDERKFREQAAAHGYILPKPLKSFK